MECIRSYSWGVNDTTFYQVEYDGFNDLEEDIYTLEDGEPITPLVLVDYKGC